MTVPTGLLMLPGDGDQLPGTEIHNIIKVTHQQTNGAYVAFEETTKPLAGSPVHVHTQQWEYYWRPHRRIRVPHR